MSKAMTKLRAHPLVDEVENEGMDDGRWFVHLKDGHCVAETLRYSEEGMREHSFSVGGAVEALKRLKTDVAPCDCSGCKKGTQ